MGDVIGSSLRASSRRQGRGLRRWLPRGGGALLASVAFHAAAAVTVGGVLARGTRGGQRPAQLVELDLAPAAELATNLPVPAAAPPVAAPSEPVRAHPAPRRRVALRLAPVVPSPEANAAPPAPADVAVAPPRFAMSAGTVATRATASPVPSSGAAAPAAGLSGGAGAMAATAFAEGDVNQPARLLSSGALVYPAAARAAAIEVDLPVEIVVDTTGRVVAARAVQRAGYGLDEAALRAIRDYRFTPAVRAGHAVPVRMRWIVQFRLR